MADVLLNSCVVSLSVLFIGFYLHRVITRAVEGIVEDAVERVIERMCTLEELERRRQRIVITDDPSSDETQIVPVWRD